jgi:hypothetical protein
MNPGIQSGRTEWRAGRIRRTRRKKLQLRLRLRLEGRTKFHQSSRWKGSSKCEGIRYDQINSLHYVLTISHGIYHCFVFEKLCTFVRCGDCFCRSAEALQTLSCVIPIPSSKLTPYRSVIIMRLVILCLFFHYRITHPVDSAFGLWLTSVICEIWFAVSWVLDQFPKWAPVERITYTDELSARYTSKL